MSALMILIQIVALPAALYFMLLMIVGFLSRLAFDAIAVLSFVLLLMSWLASSGLDALAMFVMACAHAGITLFVRMQLPHMQRGYRRWAGSQADGDG